MSLLSSLYHRELVGYSAKKYVPTDFAMQSFCCYMEDEHTILGRDYTTEVPPFASRFSDSELDGHLLACADEDGIVRLFDTRRQGSKAILKEWTAHSNAIFDIAWMETQSKLITASGDQTAALWDVHEERMLTEFRGHKGSLKSVNFRKDDIFVFATGARDGNIMLWDVRCNHHEGYYKPIDTIYDAHTIEINNTPKGPQKRTRRRKSVAKGNNQPPQSVTSVIFQDQNKIISAGAMDGNIKIWDLRKTHSTLKCKPIYCHMFPYPGNKPRRHGFSSLVLDSNSTRLYASCTNDKIYQYDCTVLKTEPLASFSGHENSTFYVKSAISPDDNYILSGSSNNHGYIWNVNKPHAPPVIVVGHVGEVTSVAWSPVNMEKIVTCSDDNNIRIWRMTRNKERYLRHYYGWSELYRPKRRIPPKTTTNAETESVTVTTPDKTSQSSSNPSTIHTPDVAPVASPLHIVRTPLSRTPNRFLYNLPSTTVVTPSTPPPTPTSQKQQLLSTWLKLTPSKENIHPNMKGTKINNGSNEEGNAAQDSIQGSSCNSNEVAENRSDCALHKDNVTNDNGKRAKKVIVTNKKKSLFSDKTIHDENSKTNKLSSTKAIDNTSKGKRSPQKLQDDMCEDISSPARKRQCLDFGDSKDNTLPQQSSKSLTVDVLNDEKENIHVGSSSCKNIEEQQKEKKVNWFIDWKIYIKHNKGDGKRRKPPLSGELAENEQIKENNEVQQPVDSKQSILNYFKPVVSPVKKITTQNNN